MKTLKALLAVTILMSFISCQKVEQQYTNSDKVIVEGYLNADQKARISVSKEITYATNDSSEMPIEELEITLTNNDISEIMIDKGSGIYESNTLIMRANEKYSMNFDYKGKLITSETTIPEKPKNYRASATSITIATFSPGTGTPPSFPDPIKLTWSNLDSRYFLVVVENIEKKPVAIFDSTMFDLKRVFRNEPLQTNSYELNMRSFNYYGTHQIILFNLNPEYVSLYENNGSSSLNLTTLPTNIEGGLGIFTGINSDTIRVEVSD
ncbi:MAG: DUF4249 family protein [Bacteroidales bacterium]|nr:DUF4249 family protein [Bacteroidales bacterium]